MDLMEAIKTRRSIKRYMPAPVPEDLLEEVSGAARLAPTADNSQPWKIVVVTEEDAKLKLAAAANGQRSMALAPSCWWHVAIPTRPSRWSGVT